MKFKELKKILKKLGFSVLVKHGAYYKAWLADGQDYALRIYIFPNGDIKSIYLETRQDETDHSVCLYSFWNLLAEWILEGHEKVITAQITAVIAQYAY